MSSRTQIIIRLAEERDRITGERRVLRTRSRRRLFGGHGTQLVYGDRPLRRFDALLRRRPRANRLLRQSLPAFTERLVAERILLAGEPIDLYLRLVLGEPEPIRPLLQEIRAVKGVETAVRAAPPAPPPADPPDLLSRQRYLQPACFPGGGPDCAGGVNAHHAWRAPGGTGAGVRLALCEESYCDDPYHRDLPPLKQLAPLPPSTSERHGTMTLGVLASRPGKWGTTGICHGIGELLFSTTRGDEVHRAIDRVMGTDHLQPLGAGDVVVINAQKSLKEFGSTQGPTVGPAEVNVDVRLAIRRAVKYGVCVVEAAANGKGLLAPVLDGQTPVWDPAEDSGAVLVGGGRSGAVPERHGVWIVGGNPWIGTNYGKRVDCQGWAEDVVTTASQGEGLEALEPIVADDVDAVYVAGYNGTSSATAMIGGVVACVQGAHRQCRGYPLPPLDLRALLRDEKLGSPQRSVPGFPAAGHPVGPLPDLRKILTHLDIRFLPLARDHLDDDGVTVGFPSEQSPDVIVATRGLPYDHDEPADWSEDPNEAPRQGADHFLYGRVRNWGCVESEAEVRVWASEPGAFTHPRYWTRIGGATLEGLRGGETRGFPVRTTHGNVWARDLMPEAGHATLVLGVLPADAPDDLPTHLTTTPDFLKFLSERGELAVRNVELQDVRPGERAIFTFVMRGVPESSGLFDFGFQTGLPAGTRVRIRTDRKIFVPAGGSFASLVQPAPGNPLDIMNPPVSFALNDVRIGASGAIRLTAEVLVPSDAAPGTFVSTVHQTRDQRMLGRMMFRMRVLDPA